MDVPLVNHPIPAYNVQLTTYKITNALINAIRTISQLHPPLVWHANHAILPAPHVMDLLRITVLPVRAKPISYLMANVPNRVLTDMYLN
jgi:hypothetical protein